ncbi:MAG: thymidine kinase [Sphingomonas sp.]|jgi:thymidine kinase
MAKLYFYYASMNAGKSTTLLQADFNYRERGMRTLLFTAAIDTRSAQGTISSRIGLEQAAMPFDAATDIGAIVRAEHAAAPLACVMIDEAQFLSEAQVLQIAALCDEARLPVLAYGLRTDFRGKLFPGSAALLALADVLVELKSVCECGAKATMNLRLDAAGNTMIHGAQTEIGGEDRYVALCRRHFYTRLAAADAAASCGATHG